MKKTPSLPANKTAALRLSAEAELRESNTIQERQAKAQRSTRRNASVSSHTEADTERLVHELQVHQVELEMQNTNLQESRDRTEVLLEKYTDLYDFAPVGYFSLDEKGRILEANLTGASFLGVNRAQLISRSFPLFVNPSSRSFFQAFLKQVFAGAGKQICEVNLRKEDGSLFWGSFHGSIAATASGRRECCRVAVMDITVRRQAEEVHRRAEALAGVNRELKEEIVQRQAAEETLRAKTQYQRQLLEQSDLMQEQFRQLSRQVISTQEDERKRISRELHDVIAQTLTGINLRLAGLKKEALANPKSLDRNIARTQRLVENSVEIVHQFARELRPPVLDDLGLIPALHSFMKHFTERTGIRAYLTAFAAVEKLNAVKRTVLFRVAQEALTNVARHAKASRVDLTIQELGDCVSMKVKDDGKSFNVEHTLQANGGKRLGLLGMRERLEMIGGNFGVESTSGQGTTIEARLPLEKNRSSRKWASAKTNL